MVDTETTLSIPTKQTIIRIMKLKDVPPQVIRHEMAVSRKALNNMRL